MLIGVSAMLRRVREALGHLNISSVFGRIIL